MTALLSGLMDLFAQALGQAISSMLQAWMADRNAQALGSATTAAATNKEATDAQDRMAAANAQPHSRDGALGRLRDGSA